MGSKESITNLKQIVESQQDDVIVVVSALGGITDKLIATAKMAARGERQYEAETEAMLARHEQMIHDVVAPERRRKAFNQVRKLFGELKEIMQGLYLLHDLSDKTMDTIVSYGERLSSQIVAQLIDDIKLYDSRDFIKTEHNGHNHSIDSDLTYRLIRETFKDMPHKALAPGFISADAQTGEITNLGRGGSDYTASLLAAALDASGQPLWMQVCWRYGPMWTDS